MDGFKLFLNEMLFHRVSPNPDMVIAFRQHLWLINYKDDQLAQSIYDTIIREHPLSQAIEQKDVSSIYDLEQYLLDYVPDSLVGHWDTKTKVLWVGSIPAMSYASSPLAKKVAQVLGARSIQYSALEPTGSDYTIKVPRRHMKGDWPDIAFHGTSSEYVEGILSKGLKAGESPSNWSIITHEDKVFLTAKLDEAKSHAAWTANKTRGIPVVVAVKIPDKKLIVPDFDVDTLATRSHYPQRERRPYDALYSVDSFKASKHAGIFGYQGRIPANHIDHLLIWARYVEKWFRINKFARLKADLRRVGNDYWERYGYWEKYG